MPLNKQAVVKVTKKTKVAEKDAIDLFVEDMNKKMKGVGRIDRGRDIAWLDPPRIRTGVLGLDVVSRGGLPRGGMVQFWGVWSCLAADTRLGYVSKGPDGRKRSGKGGSIERLYQVFHGLKGSGQGRYQKAPADSEFWLPSASEDDGIFLNRVADVAYTGEKEVYRVTTSGGLELDATEEHAFYTGEGYCQLHELSEGAYVGVHRNVRWMRKRETGERTAAGDRKYLYLKFHPVAGRKVVDEQYVYYRVSLSRAVVEASLNSMTLEEYVERLNSNNYAGMKFLSRDDHVHHMDEDYTNDTLSNLEVMQASAHGRLHALERHLSWFRVTFEEIKSIKKVGRRATYDVRMASPFNNFVAAGFVVHNSGKTTTALHVMRSEQRRGKTTLFGAGEGFQKDWARKNALWVPYSQDEYEHVEKLEIPAAEKKELSVKMREYDEWGVENGFGSVVVAQHVHGDGLLEAVARAVKSNLFSVCVVDSLAILKNTRQLEEMEVGDESYGGGGQVTMFNSFIARCYSALNTKYDDSGAVNMYGDIANQTCVICLNQARVKIGGMKGRGAGAVLYQPVGGEGLKHAWHLSIAFRKGEQLGEQDSVGGEQHWKPWGQQIKVVGEKSKVGPPGRYAEWDLYTEDHGAFRQGTVDAAKETRVWGAYYDVIVQEGAWYRLPDGARIQGKDAVDAHLRENESLADSIQDEVIARCRR